MEDGRSAGRLETSDVPGSGPGIRDSALIQARASNGGRPLEHDWRSGPPRTGDVLDASSWAGAGPDPPSEMYEYGTMPCPSFR